MTTTAAELVEIALAEVARTGPELGAAVLVSQSSSMNLRWALNGLTTNGLTTSGSVTVIVGAPVRTASGTGTGSGVLTRQGLDAEGVRALVADTVALARSAEPAEDAAPFVTGSEQPGFADPGAETGASTLAPVAEALGDVFGRSRESGRESFGFALHEVTTTWLGTTGGLRYRHEQPQGSIQLTGKAGARSRSAYVARGTRDFSDVDVLALDDEIATRLRWQERRIDLEPGRYTTVLPPTSVADLMVYYHWSAEARGAHEGRTVFSRPGGGTRVGERITGSPVSLISDPYHHDLGCADRVLAHASSETASAFDNGLPSPAVTWLDRGTISALPTTRHTAGLTGLPVTPTPDNLVLTGENGTAGTDELVAGVERGLLIGSLWYIREVDPQSLLLTGLTRDGVYVVENGEIVGAAGNFRFNESPVDVLSRIEAYGATEVCLSREWCDWYTRTAMPPLRIDGFNMSTVAEGS